MYLAKLSCGRGDRNLLRLSIARLSIVLMLRMDMTSLKKAEKTTRGRNNLDFKKLPNNSGQAKRYVGEKHEKQEKTTLHCGRNHLNFDGAGATARNPVGSHPRRS
jgi:hypothetical protein